MEFSLENKGLSNFSVVLLVFLFLFCCFFFFFQVCCFCRINSSFYCMLFSGDTEVAFVFSLNAE